MSEVNENVENLNENLSSVVRLTCSEKDVLLLARANASDTRLYLSMTDILLGFCVSTQEIPDYILTISISLCFCDILG